MNRVSTLQLNESTFVSNDWADDFAPHPPQELTKEPASKPSKPASAPQIHLPWEADQHVVSLPVDSFYTRYGKRIVDVLIAGLVTIFVLSWLIPVVGILIMLESRGPFFFIQKRSGQKGVPFFCFKFRTMRHAQHKSGFRQTEREDARVTRLGRFLRRTNLDEMPQFLNVLMGDMSLVGPRPHALQHDAIHWSETAYRERYWAKPGITGLAQVRGSRGATSMTQRMEHRVQYDHFYIPRQTFLLDMKICIRTVTLMLMGDKNAW